MDITKNDIKQVILEVSGVNASSEDLQDDDELLDLGFNNVMVLALAMQLNDLARTGGKGKIIRPSDITSDMTVREIVDLLLKD